LSFYLQAYKLPIKLREGLFEILKPIEIDCSIGKLKEVMVYNKNNYRDLCWSLDYRYLISGYSREAYYNYSRNYTLISINDLGKYKIEDYSEKELNEILYRNS
jgi:hypothetical protein